MEKELAAVNKRKSDHEKMQKKVDAIRRKSTDPSKWNAGELQTMVSWFKRPGDSKLPQRKEQLMEQYMLTCNRSETERNRLKEGEQPIIDDATAERDVAGEQPAYENNAGEEGIAEALLQMLTEV